MFCISGKETELYGELSKQITEFLALKSQLEHIEKQRNESYDQETESHDLGTEPCDLGVESRDLGTESHDLVQDQDQDIASREPLPATCADPSPSSTVITATSSRNSASTASENSPIATSCSVAHVHTHSATSGQSNAISRSSQSNTTAAATITSNGQTGEATCSRSVNISVVDAPPPVSAHQPWPVTSILSQDSTGSHCQHAMTTNNHVLPTSCHRNRNLTTSGGQNSSTIQNTSAHIQNISPVSSVSTYSLFHQPISSMCTINSSVSSSTQQRSVVIDHHIRAHQNNVTSHSRTGSGLASLHGNYQYHHNSSEPQQVIRHSRERQREMGCGGGYSPSNQSREQYHSTSTQVQLHTSAIVQPWVESSHRPRPLHHVTNTTPMPRISHQPQYNPLHVQHHQEQHRQNTQSHTERFMPYSYPRMNHHNSSSTFSPGSWSHDNHMITPVGTSGRDIAPQGRSYASSPYDLHQQQFSTPGRSCISNYDYSRNNCSITQGHPSWMPYFTSSQQNSSRSSNMSHDTQATPPYPIQPQPHPHGSGSSSTSPAVWRPYSERTRSSGFCLADILSLPSETEPTPLSLDVTPPTGHHSFLVNRLLDDI